MDHASYVDAAGRQVGLGRSAVLAAPFLALALLPLAAFPSDAVMRGFVLTAIAVFTVHMPIVASAFGLHADDKADMPMPRAAYLWLLLLWATTDWALCLLWR
jgi:hypothetical protein